MVFQSDSGSDSSDDSSDGSSEGSSDDSGDESGSSSGQSRQSEVPTPAPKKRKVEEDSTPKTPATKKIKAESNAVPASKNLFVGNLSWNVDEEWLTRDFGSFGELSGVRIISDRESGRSKG